jgi:hypothetical protein
MGNEESQLNLRGHIKTGQRNVARDQVVLLRRLLWRQACFRAPTPWTAFEHMAVMEHNSETQIISTVLSFERLSVR